MDLLGELLEEDDGEDRDEGIEDVEGAFSEAAEGRDKTSLGGSLAGEVEVGLGNVVSHGSLHYITSCHLVVL